MGGGFAVSGSQHPQKNPGVSQLEVRVGGEVCVAVGVVGSRQPNHPGCSQVLVEVAVEVGRVVVTGGPGVASVVVVGSLQPNQPGVLHVLDDVDEDELVEVAVVVVLSSKHPHHPGVSHVEVLVDVVLVELAVVLVVVVISDPLLRKNFHSSQS